jgi:predicted dinucleotide-binding enzyme
MQLGLIGLGKMGGNMRERIRRAGHEVVGYDRDPKVSDVRTMAAMVKALDAPRTVWVMFPPVPRPATRSPSSATCSTRATSSSTAATRASPMTSSTQRC